MSYDKIRLVPFGETLSFFRYLPFIGTIVAVGEFERGESITLFRTRGVPFSTIICFESYFGAQTREAARKGAEFLVLITNDGWYRESAGPYQHHAQSILRAVETRRPLLRCAYTGISSIIDPSGRRVARLDLSERGVVHGEIQPQTGTTFFVRWGNVWVIGAASILLFGLGLFAWSKARAQGNARQA
jgi:apolipoprotein N-acyltransferase